MVPRKKWEECDKAPAPDLALMTKADIHGRKSEQKLGKEALIATQESLLKATGQTSITNKSRQYLMMSVSFSLCHSRECSQEHSFLAFPVRSRVHSWTHKLSVPSLYLSGHA